MKQCRSQNRQPANQCSGVRVTTGLKPYRPCEPRCRPSGGFAMRRRSPRVCLKESVSDVSPRRRSWSANFGRLRTPSSSAGKGRLLNSRTRSASAASSRCPGLPFQSSAQRAVFVSRTRGTSTILSIGLDLGLDLFRGHLRHGGLGQCSPSLSETSDALLPQSVAQDSLDLLRHEKPCFSRLLGECVRNR
jgi:hypothetical protein